MSKKSKTPSFICEFRLAVSPKETKKLHSKFEVARQFYNQCLAEARTRYELMRQSKQIQAIRHLPKSQKEEKQNQFSALKKQFQFEEYALHDFAKRLGHAYFGQHLDSHVLQKLASRAFSAVEKVWYRQAKKVRFKGKYRLASIEGKSNKTGIKWRHNQILWQGLKLKAILNPKDPLQSYALQQKVKYVRLLRRKIRTNWHFYAQLVVQGKPYQKPKKKGAVQLDGVVGLDLGPSSIAIVSEQSADLKAFCPELVEKAQIKRKFQRKLDRQRRANNPKNYNANGTIKKGRKVWKNSKRYAQTLDRVSDMERKLAAQRKTSHGTLLNQVLLKGKQFHFEKLNYKAWQKSFFGKSIKRNAPAQFIDRLKRKAECAGASVLEINTYSTKLSQTCHCGLVKKKKLSERIHTCECGVLAQRDLYSAYLACFVDQNSGFHAEQAVIAWPSADVLLQTAWTKAYQTASVSLLRNSFGKPPSLRQSGSSEKGERSWNSALGCCTPFGFEGLGELRDDS
ncbi:MAG: transposase [Planctomycetota bacterium]